MKVIQIAGAGGGLYALAEDGTIWAYQGIKWAQVRGPFDHTTEEDTRAIIR